MALLIVFPFSQTGVETTNVKMSMNPFCEIALEEALRIRESGLAKEVVAVSVGPSQCADTLRTALAMGADRAVHVDAGAAYVPPLSVAKILRALVQAEQPGLLILGKQVIYFVTLVYILGNLCTGKGQMMVRAPHMISIV
jgi:electron transfer flavoprotein beta subunit